MFSFLQLTTQQTVVYKHIDDMREILSIKWYETLKTIITNSMKRKWIPDVAKPRSLNRFFNGVAAQMTQNLQDVAVRSLLKFTEFICGVRNYEIIYESQNQYKKIIFP